MKKLIPLFLLSLVSFPNNDSSSALAENPAYEGSELLQLASPEFEGRGVGTQGLDKARDLLKAKLKEANIAPAFTDRGGNPSYGQALRVFIGNDLGKENFFTGAEKDQFLPLAFSRSGSLENLPLVFVGFGITARQEGQSLYDDYEGLDVKGKIVLAFTGDPGTGNKDSIFRNPALYHYSTLMYKAQNAELHGAAGIVFVRDPLSLDGAEPPLKFQDRQGGGATLETLAGQVSLAFAEKILGKNLKEIQSNIAQNQKPQSFETALKVGMKVDLNRHLGQVENVAGFVPGTDPALANEYIMIGAHYDHLGFGGDFALDPSRNGEVHPGADDNASGTQMVLNLARAVKAEGKNRRPVVFVFFTAEEIGLLGSRSFVENMPLPEGAKAVALINMDMVGRLRENRLSALALRSGKEFAGIVDKVNQSISFDLVKGDTGFGSSDHASFLNVKIPCLFFTTGSHTDYHRVSDTADRINFPGMQKIQSFILEVWRAIDQAPTPPTYDPASEDAKEPPRAGKGYGVYFGSIPDVGGDPTLGGVLLQGTRPGSPAEKAGLQKGDILTGIGEIKIRNLQDFVFALRFYRPNEVVLVQWQRAGVGMQGSTTLRKREE